METKKIIAFLIVAIILVLIMIAYKTTDRVVEDKKQKELSENKGNGNNTQELPTLKPGASEGADENNGTGGASGGEGGGAGGGGTGGGEAGNKTENKTLPSDINTKPCGFYFGEYAVCAGTCPSGSCVQEGRSCYCKEV